MKFGIIGTGLWGAVWHRQLDRMGHQVSWQRGQSWRVEKTRPDAVIIASSADSHYWLARELMRKKIPIVIEKPMCLRASHARHLVDVGLVHDAIAFTDHTRLYSPAWREFRDKALEDEIQSVRAEAGGPCKLDPWWDWGSHLVAMCLDLGFDPAKAEIVTSRNELALTLQVNDGLKFQELDETGFGSAEGESPLAVLVNEFCQALEKGEPDIRGLRLGRAVVEALEAKELSGTL